MKNFLKRAVKKLPFTGALIRRFRQRRRSINVIHKVKGRNTISYRGANLSAVTFDIEGDNNRITIEENCVFNNVSFYVRGDNHSITIKSGCVFRHGGDIWMEDSECSLFIEENSTFENVHLALTESKSTIKIGRDCMFASDIDVRTGDSHSIVLEQTGERINRAKNVLIGNHVWIAAHCVILKGVTIADNSVIATGSIVTRSFEKSGIIIGGNPAVQLKEGINWLRERI